MKHLKEVSTKGVNASVMPLLLVNQVIILTDLKKEIELAVAEGNKENAQKAFQKILQMQMRERVILDMPGGFPVSDEEKELEADMLKAYSVQYQMHMPQMLKDLYEANLISVEDILKLNDSFTGASVIDYIKDEATSFSLALAIKQKDWSYVVDSKVLAKGVLGNHKDLIEDIASSFRVDILAKFAEQDVFGMTAGEYAVKIEETKNNFKAELENYQAGEFKGFNIEVNQAVKDGSKEKATVLMQKLLRSFKQAHKSEMPGGMPLSEDENDLRVAVENVLNTEFHYPLPAILNKLFVAKLITADELLEIAKTEPGFAPIIESFKQLAVDEENSEAFGEIALVLAIKQKDWKFVIESGLLEEGSLSDYEDLITDIFESGRMDLVNLCKEKNVFGFDERVYAEAQARLNEAARNGDLATIRKCIALGANPNVTDEQGNNALINAVTYSPEEVEQMNVVDSKRTVEIKQLMANKSAVVRYLLDHAKVDVHHRNSAGLNAFDVCTSQGLTKTERGITELRGDHNMMNALLSSGVNPIFGETEWSFKFKSMVTACLSVVVTTLKNVLLDLPVLGVVVRTLCPPLVTALNLACDWLVAKRAYYDALNPATIYARTALDSEYANDAFLSLDKKPMIGSYHINWLGQVYAGKDLKDFMQNHVGYSDVSKGYFSIGDLPIKEVTDDKGNVTSSLHMNIKDRLKLTDSMHAKYAALQEKLKGFMMPWTRSALSKLAEEIETAFELAHPGSELDAVTQKKIEDAFNDDNFESVLAEIASDPAKSQLFFQIYESVKSGALKVSIKARHNAELIAQSLATGVAVSEIKVGKSKVFSDININAKDCAKLLATKNEEFRKEVTENKDIRTWFEYFKDGACKVGRGLVNLAADVGAKATGTDRSTVLDNVANVAAHVAAGANAAGHVGLRRFYDSSYFVPVTGLLTSAYCGWQYQGAIKTIFQTIASFVTSAISAVKNAFGSLMNFVSRGYNGNDVQASTAINVVNQDTSPVVNVSPEVARMALLENMPERGVAAVG